MEQPSAKRVSGPWRESPDPRGPVEMVDTFMAGWLAARPLPANLLEAIRYALLAPGKRLRPLLAMRSCEAVGGSAAEAVVPAAALEMVHAFSLVHDDLPAMDDDDLRRGRPTLHRHSSEAMAILAGDALAGLAMELITTRVEPAELAAHVARELAVATNDMIAGQVYDTVPAACPARGPHGALTPLQELERIHRHKTGALIRAACRIGGLCGGAGPAALAALTVYGEAVGLMFQVVDDVLDVTQTTEHLGKTAGKDEGQRKLTYPAVLGLEGSRREARRLQDQALEALQALDERARPLAELCEWLAVRTR